ncbi:MAG: glycine-rich domain-containing protein, partial [bacterium]
MTTRNHSISARPDNGQPAKSLFLGRRGGSQHTQSKPAFGTRPAGRWASGLLAAGCALFVTLLVASTASAATTTVPFTGSSSWTVPSGVNWITVECWGGGGAGGGIGLAGNTTGSGGGGAGGQYAKKVLAVTPGTTYTVTVGASVTGTKGAGSAGADTTFATTTVVAKGGAGGGTATGGGSGTGGVGST